MKEDTAKKLLNKIMGWKSAQDEGNEYPDLQALATFGYDNYQQFKPGMRFIESLAIWLSEFPPEKRTVAYNFVKKNVLFVTRPQMEHVVSTAYQDFVIPEILKRVSQDTGIPKWRIKKLHDCKEYKILHDQTLFLSLSDGSHIDDFRRSHSKINHEQVSRTHEISSRRAEKMRQKLEERLKQHSERAPKKYFRNIFLLDDFSASGISYIKEDSKERNGVKGKIGMFFDSINDEHDPLKTLVKLDDLHVYVILYYATETAVKKIQSLGSKTFKNNKFTVIPIQLIPDTIKFDEVKEKEFAALVKNKEYGWKDIIDEHFREGNIEKPYLGFNGDGLTLVLYHNTPNNSLPILYRNEPDKTKFKGLFPRFSRHK